MKSNVIKQELSNSQSNPNAGRQYLTVHEAAGYLRTSAHQIRLWHSVMKKYGLGPRKSGKKFTYRVDELDTLSNIVNGMIPTDELDLLLNRAMRCQAAALIHGPKRRGRPKTAAQGLRAGLVS